MKAEVFKRDVYMLKSGNGYLLLLGLVLISIIISIIFYMPNMSVISTISPGSDNVDANIVSKKVDVMAEDKSIIFPNKVTDDITNIMANSYIDNGAVANINDEYDDYLDSHLIKFEKIYNDFSKNLVGINKDVIDYGDMFTGDFSALKSLPLQSAVVVEIEGSKWLGKIVKRKPSLTLVNNTYVKVKFENQGEYMTAYFNGESVKGKIYTSDDSYIYESNGSASFIISIYEYKKINNALKID